MEAIRLSPRSDDRFVARGTVNGLLCDILLDSGASVSVFRQDLAEKSGMRWRKCAYSTIRGAGNNFLDVSGMMKTKVKIDDKMVYVDMYVTPNLSQPCILGVDGLKALNVVMDFRKSEMFVNEVKYPVDVGNCDANIKEKLFSLLDDYKDLFCDVVPGAAKGVEHKIQTIPHDPIVSRMKRIPLNDQIVIEAEVKKMLDAGVIGQSKSPYRFPVVLVDKKDGEKRFCVNYRRLNDVTVKDKQPLPLVDDLLDETQGSKVFCILDMSSAYWQVSLAKEDRPKTAFSTNSGHYEFNVMPFGLTNAPATQQEAMRRILRGIPKVNVLLDDVIIHGRNNEETLCRLEEVFKRFRERQLRLKMKKCAFLKKSIRYLGFVISENGKEMDPAKTVAIRDYPKPRSVKELRSFLGMASFCRKFVAGYANIVAPLYSLTSLKSKWIWTKKCDDAFRKVKEILQRPPVLACPDLNAPYLLRIYTDASGTGMGSALKQIQNGKERVIAYASRCFNERERRLYAPIEKEAAAVIWAVNHFRPYLKGSRFRIVSDHSPLKWLFSRTDASGRLGRWQAALIEHEGLEGIDYIRGIENQLADGLSRMPEILPLGNCVEFVKLQEEDMESENVGHLLRKEGKVWTFKGRPYVPRSLRNQIVDQLHTGHFGMRRMVHLVGSRFYWPKYKDDVEKFLRKCLGCQLRTTPISYPESLPTSEYPFQRVVIDFAGPLSRTQSGNRYFLVIQDDFSRYLRIVSSRDCSSKVVIDALNQLIQDEGVPEEILSDNGSHFCATVVQRWMQLHQVRHVRSPPGHQQSNGMAERVIRTIKEHLRAMACYQREDALMKIQFTYNRSIHNATGYSPFDVARGRTSRMPLSGMPEEAIGKPKKVLVSWRRFGRRSEEFKNKRNERKVNQRKEFGLKEGDQVLVWEKGKGWKERGRIRIVLGRMVELEDGRKVSKDWVIKLEK